MPRLPNGKPDLSGLWANPYTPDMATKGTVLDPQTQKPLDLSRAEIDGCESPGLRRRCANAGPPLHRVGPEALEIL